MTRVVHGHVFSGGGPAGVYHAAAMRTLAEADETISYPDIVSGTSAGALVAILLAQGQSRNLVSKLALLEQVFLAARRRDVWTYRPLGLLGDLVRGLAPKFVRRWFKWRRPPGYGVFATHRLRRLVETYVSRDELHSSPTKVLLCAVSRTTGRKCAFTTQREGEPAAQFGAYLPAGVVAPDIVQAALASSAFPGLTCPEWILGEEWVDGGLRDITPWQSAYLYWKTHLQGTRLHLRVITTVPEQNKYAPSTNWGPLAAAGRMLGVLTSEVAAGDLVFPDDPDLRVDLLQPKYGLPASVTDFTEESTRATARQGVLDSQARWRRVTDWESGGNPG